MNNTYFVVHDVVLMMQSGEWDRVDICLEPLNDHDFGSAEGIGEEDFGGMLFITLIVYFSGRSLKLNYLCNVLIIWEVFLFFS